ncbi:hypothetical protein IWQ60_011735 [Tieghemiomyces parasiticus]|uniref:Large ribosomal subunit protein mL46 n=1 Tax=Tieghemiomyces parasiticus TaxID=78921 RepID=A0A9W8DLD2_9FUNG|nr:hypothetical protein IWQ60_011735 [Tieghemiomyces parasiticus]
MKNSLLLTRALRPVLQAAPRRTLATEAGPSHRIVASVILQRNPSILPEATPFEKLYHSYKEELDRRASAPFAAEFYFKKGSIGEKEWQARQKVYAARAKEGWQTVLSEEPIAETTSESVGPSVTEADQKQDVKSLDRALAESLYLLVKKPRTEHAWQFPQGGMVPDEKLHQTARRELGEECGQDMDVWFVGRGPVGHYTYPYPKEHAKKIEAEMAKVFFLRAYIFAGQVKVNKKEVTDFAWLKKDEIPNYVSREYWAAVKDLL